MKHLFFRGILMLVMSAMIAWTVHVHATDLTIASLDGQGRLVFDAVSNATAYRLEWTSDLKQGWTNFTGDLVTDIRGGYDGVATSQIPMMFRVIPLSSSTSGQAAAAALVVLTNAITAREPEQTVFGRLSFNTSTNVPWYRLQWSAQAGGPWSNMLALTLLNRLEAPVGGSITCAVPLHFRVRELAKAPTGMVRIPACTYSMGDPFAEGETNELPRHLVALDSFFISETPITKGQWFHVRDWAFVNGYDDMYQNIVYFKTTNHPATGVISWYDAVKWCNARSEMEGLIPCYYLDAGHTLVYRFGKTNLSANAVDWHANGYRLPTEAEWEYAARGGADGRRFAWSDTDTVSHARANYFAVSNLAYEVGSTFGYHPDFDIDPHPYCNPVYSFAPNDYGVYDIVGNLMEWCWDRADYGYYNKTPLINPHGPETEVMVPGSDLRIMRGGTYADGAYQARCARRVWNWADIGNFEIGVRVVRTAD